jgi:hypothetical protein
MTPVDVSILYVTAICYKIRECRGELLFNPTASLGSTSVPDSTIEKADSALLVAGGEQEDIRLFFADRTADLATGGCGC